MSMDSNFYCCRTQTIASSNLLSLKNLDPQRVRRCDKGAPLFRGETGSILRKGYAGIHCGFLSYMLSFLPYTYLFIIPSLSLCPFHSYLNEPPPSFCLHTTVDPHHLISTTAS
ncbi:hypothetical protein Y032_0003g1346 [Ancylostoma ceylanicum]|uniref:Uncharacterized protein n=1 Tax=Ancylostoma ceylanicum TaxID=53326 RepID=A0A016VYB0_9BILA|nr:hypothetical protein Y032_0003g1346 [Ancylostoma ceylanicum]